MLLFNKKREEDKHFKVHVLDLVSQIQEMLNKYDRGYLGVESRRILLLCQNNMLKKEKHQMFSSIDDFISYVQSFVNLNDSLSVLKLNEKEIKDEEVCNSIIKIIHDEQFNIIITVGMLYNEVFLQKLFDSEDAFVDWCKKDIKTKSFSSPLLDFTHKIIPMIDVASMSLKNEQALVNSLSMLASSHR